MNPHPFRFGRHDRALLVIAISYGCALGAALVGNVALATFFLAAGISHFVFRRAAEDAARRDALEDYRSAWAESE